MTIFLERQQAMIGANDPGENRRNRDHALKGSRCC
jgi:hypothetical protein